MAQTITARNGDRVADLRHEIAELRRELAALRDSLAAEVRTQRVIVELGDRGVEITPGWVSVSDEANGCRVVLSASREHAEVDVTAGDVTPPRDSGIDEHVSLVAWVERDVVPGGPHAEVTVNGVELAAPAPAAPPP